MSEKKTWDAGRYFVSSARASTVEVVVDIDL